MNRFFYLIIDSIGLLTASYPKTFREKVRWFFINFRYGLAGRPSTLSKPIRFRKQGAGVWDVMRKQFGYVGNYYCSKDYLHAPAIRNTMFSLPEYFASIDPTSRTIVQELSLEISRVFGVDSRGTHAWLTTFAAIVARIGHKDKKCLAALQDSPIIEFGPGTGLAGILYNRLLGQKVYFLDLEEVTRLRGKILELLADQTKRDLGVSNLAFEDFCSSEVLENFSFISTWAFSETPVEVRERYKPFLAKSKIVLIIANAKFNEVENHQYFGNNFLSQSHELIADEDLSFLGKNYPSYMKRHRFYLYRSKSLKAYSNS